MLNVSILHLKMVAGRLVGGVLILSADHPIVMALILTTTAGASGAVLLDAVAVRRHKRL